MFSHNGDKSLLTYELVIDMRNHLLITRIIFSCVFFSSQIRFDLYFYDKGGLGTLTEADLSDFLRDHIQARFVSSVSADIIDLAVVCAVRTFFFFLGNCGDKRSIRITGTATPSLPKKQPFQLHMKHSLVVYTLFWYAEYPLANYQSATCTMLC